LRVYALPALADQGLYKSLRQILSVKKERIGFTDPELDASYQRALSAIKKAGIDLRYERHKKA
jgi:hypothetical protein